MEADKTQVPQATETFDVFKWMAWFHANLKTVLTAVVAVAVVAIAISLYSWKQGENEHNAGEALTAQLGTVFPGKDAHASTDGLLKIAAEYPSTSSGMRAQLLAAETLFADGKYDQANSQFTKFIAQYSASPLVAQASYGIAASLEAQNKLDESVTKYQDIAAKYPGSGVAEPSKLAVGRVYEAQGKLDKAVKEYDNLTKGANRNDTWAVEAYVRLENILGLHPELRPAPVVSPTDTATPEAAAPVPAAKPAPAATPAAAPKTTNAAGVKH